MKKEHSKHVHAALMQTMIGAFCLSIVWGSLLGAEYTKNGNKIIPVAQAEELQVTYSVADNLNSYMDCDCVGPNVNK